MYIEQSVISNKAMQIIFLKFRENLLPNVLYTCVHGYAHALGMLPHALRMGSHFTHQVWNGVARHGISCDITVLVHNLLVFIPLFHDNYYH